MKTNIILIIIILISVILISVIFIIDATRFLVEENQKYIYECTDYKGNLIYCKNACWTKGGIFGTTEDGRTIVITSYKRILKEYIKLKE